MQCETRFKKCKIQLTKKTKPSILRSCSFSTNSVTLSGGSILALPIKGNNLDDMDACGCGCGCGSLNQKLNETKN
jgi:hypothetical protein